MAGEPIMTADGWVDHFADCDACGAEHPEGVLEGGLCPECLDTVKDYPAGRQALQEASDD